MNKNLIMQLLNKKMLYNKDEEELMGCIEEAKNELHVARELFEFVSDPQLIELAIHAENLARTRYDYLISIAKEKEFKKKVE